MRVYRTSILFVILFAIAYPVIVGSVLVTRRHTSVVEVYPFAPWSLFCFIPNHESDYGIRLTAIDGRPPERGATPDAYADLPEKQKIVAYNVVQRMGDLYEQGKTDAFEEQRAFFEQSFLGRIAESTHYEIVRQDFDVLRRWQTGECDRIEPLVECVCQNSTERD